MLRCFLNNFRMHFRIPLMFILLACVHNIRRIIVRDTFFCLWDTGFLMAMLWCWVYEVCAACSQSINRIYFCSYILAWQINLGCICYCCRSFRLLCSQFIGVHACFFKISCKLFMPKENHDSTSLFVIRFANVDAQAFTLFVPLVNDSELSESMYMSSVCHLAFSGSFMGSAVAGEALACTWIV